MDGYLNYGSGTDILVSWQIKPSCRVDEFFNRCFFEGTIIGHAESILFELFWGWERVSRENEKEKKCF
jgi:hypothetical protein